MILYGCDGGTESDQKKINCDKIWVVKLTRKSQRREKEILPVFVFASCDFFYGSCRIYEISVATPEKYINQGRPCFRCDSPCVAAFKTFYGFDVFRSVDSSTPVAAATNINIFIVVF